MMKTWLINNYGGPSRIVGDIIYNLTRMIKPAVGNRKEKFAFYSSITGAIRRLERLSRVNHIDKVELESCSLSQSTLSSSLVRLLLASEYDLWVQEMTLNGLDFKNPVGIESFNCFKRVCNIERNINECSRSDPDTKESQNAVIKKVSNTIYKVHQQELESSGDESNQLFMQCQHQSKNHGTLPQD